MIEMKCIHDVDRLMSWRKEVIAEVFGQEPSRELLRANRDYYWRHIADGSHLAVVAEVDGHEAGCGSVCFTEELPSPDNPTGLCAYLMNIYVRAEYRNRGLAHLIVRRLMAESVERRCAKIYLEATAAAKPVYRDSGFFEMQDMMKYGGN